MQGVSRHDLVTLYEEDRSTLYKIIDEKIGMSQEELDSSYYYNRKQRHIARQLRRLGYKMDILFPVPSHCPLSRVKLTYNIYGDEYNNATVFVDNGVPYIAAKFTEGKNGDTDRW